MKVNNYDYPDMCAISRSTGNTDNLGNELFTLLYNDCCEIQYGGSGNTSLHVSNYQSSPMLFIPVSNIDFEINDKVVVTSLNGRISEYTIGQFESLDDFNDTCIWLKGGVE